MAQRQLLGGRKHEGGDEKGMTREKGRDKGGKGEAGEDKIWWVTIGKMKTLKKGKNRKGWEGCGVYGMSSSGLCVRCQMCWGGSC